MLRDKVEADYRESLYKSLVEREADLIEQELTQEDAKQIFLNRAIYGQYGLRKMTADDMISENSFCEEAIGEEYVSILAKYLMMDEHKEDLNLLIDILTRNGVAISGAEETCPRRKTLISYLEEYSEYDYEEIEAGKEPNHYVVKYGDGGGMEYKVYTEQECISELAKWYESDMECMWFSTKEISDVLGIPEEMLETLELLTSVSDGSGEGTKFLYQTLKKAGKLEELASRAKINNFGYLAYEFNSRKVGDYYVLNNDY